MVRGNVLGTCDECKAEFNVVLEEVASARGGLTIQFACPNGHVYPVGYLSSRAVVVREELNAKRQQYARSHSAMLLAEIGRLTREYQTLYVGLAGRGDMPPEVKP